MADQPKVVEFGRPEIDPESQAHYGKQIQKAREELKSGSVLDRLKRSTPVGHVARPENMPDLAVAAATPARGHAQMEEELRGGVSPRPAGSPVLREETAQQLKEMGEEMKKQKTSDPVKDPAEQAPKDQAKSDQELLEALDFGAVRNEAERIHNNKERKRTIESRCKEMDFDDLLWKGEVQQLVPILPGRFEVVFRSLTGDDNLFIRKYMAKQARHSDAYDFDVYSLCQLTLSIVAIYGKTERKFDVLANERGEIDENLFQRKLKIVSGFALPILADLSVNQNWFDIRVRRLINPEDLKNG